MNTIRWFARILIPGIIRRPIADRIYQLISIIISIKYRMKVSFEKIIKKWHLQLRIISSRISQLPLKLTLSSWQKLQCYREYFASNSVLNWKQRCHYKMLEMIMKFCESHDTNYRNYFAQFKTAFKCLRTRIKANDFKGITLMNGSLGAGGAERQVILTLQSLKQRSYGPLTLIPFFLRTTEQCFYYSKVKSLGISIVELNRARHQMTLPTPDPIFELINKLPLELATDVSDCVFTLLPRCPEVIHLWLDEINIKGGLAAVILGIPKIILSTRNLPPINFALYKPYMREGYRYLMRQPGIVMLNNSKTGARAYEKWLGLPRGTVRVVHNGFDFDDGMLDYYCSNRLSYRIRCGIPKDVPLVGTVIRLQEEKRPLLWAEIAAYVRKKIPNAHFLVIGDGPLRSEFEMRGKHSDLSGALHIVGREEEVFAAMATMDLFLLTSRAEGLPNVLIEAQALGVPVVTTPAGGARETLDHKRTGWVLKSKHIAVIGNKIVRLLLDQEWRKKAGEASRQFVRDHFKLDRMIEETLAIYNSLEVNTNISQKKY